MKKLKEVIMEATRSRTLRVKKLIVKRIEAKLKILIKENI